MQQNEALRASLPQHFFEQLQQNAGDVAASLQQWTVTETAMDRIITQFEAVHRLVLQISRGASDEGLLSPTSPSLRTPSSQASPLQTPRTDFDDSPLSQWSAPGQPTSFESPAPGPAAQTAASQRRGSRKASTLTAAAGGEEKPGPTLKKAGRRASVAPKRHDESDGERPPPKKERKASKDNTAAAKAGAHHAPKPKAPRDGTTPGRAPAEGPATWVAPATPLEDAAAPEDAGVPLGDVLDAAQTSPNVPAGVVQRLEELLLQVRERGVFKIGWAIRQGLTHISITNPDGAEPFGEVSKDQGTNTDAQVTPPRLQQPNPPLPSPSTPQTFTRRCPLPLKFTGAKERWEATPITPDVWDNLQHARAEVRGSTDAGGRR